MKSILRWIVDGYHWVHIAWAVLIPLAAAYIFFTEPDMNWRIDLITAIIFIPFVVFAILLFRSMFRKRSITSTSSTLIPKSPLLDPIQNARKNVR
jgi:choline-glycine betaine transporter